MNTKRLTLALAGIALVGATAFGVLEAMGDDVPADGATCLVGTVDCADADLGGDTPVLEDEADSGDDRVDGELLDTIEQEAHGLLGMFERDLPADVRIGRRGTEQVALTEDHVVGRLTVGLEDTDGSGLRVVDVTAELPNGTATYTLMPG